MSFPPFFSKFGKACNDLHKKKFDYDVNLKSIHKTPDGMTLETTGVFHENSVSGKTKVTHKDKNFGETEVELHTATGKLNTQTKFTKFADGATATFSGGYCPKTAAGKNKLTGFYLNLKGDYRQEFFSSEAGLTVQDQESPASFSVGLNASAAIGFNGLAVGAAVAVDASKQALKDYNLGVQYAQKDFTAALTTQENADRINASWHYNVNRNWTIGSKFSTNPFVGDKSLSLASQYQVDVDTTAKVKLCSGGNLGAAIEHRLQNPRMKVNVAGQFKFPGQGIPRATKFGFGATFGDY